ncbi:MAG: divergent polysaccharide deacetylase family protein [Campylobacter sp.]|nr:divergent polysaccharide deacetylase family protein [Campylobacter sp.]
MSEKKLIQLQRFLIIAVLFLLCVALVLVILNTYQSTQKKSPQNQAREQNLSLFTSPPTKIVDENVSNPFKELYYENIILSKDFNESENLEQNLSKDFYTQNSLEKESEQNLSLSQISFENNLSKDFNQSFENLEQNLSLEELASKEVNQTELNLAELNQNKSEKLSTLKTQKIDFKKGPAKLAIIIDDMANEKQVKGLKALNLKIIPSFFPPDKNHKTTPQLASKFDFYMVHLPLAAINYKKAELDTLIPSDSEERIFKKIANVKEDFKNLKYINNHTGSLFTSDEKAMKKLYKALKEKGFVFVDSKTIENSKVEKVAKEFGEFYIQRDVFLDNKDDVSEIKKQLQKAVNLARKKGFAIAIGHPRKNTFKALEESKGLLKSIKLVYLSEIYGE